MDADIQEVKCKSILSDSRLYEVDYSINPYTGCMHGCAYCYATYMKKYSGHKEDWGKFVDVKTNAVKALRNDLAGAKKGSILLSSVTDPYQPLERDYGLTRGILKILADTDFGVSILTKGCMVLRDLDVFEEFSEERLSIGLSINYLDDEHRRNWEPYASPIPDRVNALKKINSKGIPTYLHVGPWFEGITSLEKILHETKDFINELQVENLNLRRQNIIRQIIRRDYPDLIDKYNEIIHDDSLYKIRLKRKVKELNREFDVPIRVFID